MSATVTTLSSLERLTSRAFAHADGWSVPQVFIPRLLELWRQGRLVLADALAGQSRGPAR